jgi:hypothetical protein
LCVRVPVRLVGLVELGAADFGSLSQTERIDAPLVLEQHRAWLDGLQQQLLAAAVAAADRSKDYWHRSTHSRTPSACPEMI